jgi:hypothetical protein
MNNTYSNTFNLKYSNGIKKTNSLKISKEMEKTFDKSIPKKIKNYIFLNIKILILKILNLIIK